MTSHAPSSSLSNDAPRFWRAIPAGVWAIALLTGLLHLLPVWHAQRETPEGWTFTGVTSVSPDHMQYRVWMRRTAHTGFLVDNPFTTEENGPHLPVIFYYVSGHLARALKMPSEFFVEYAGVAFNVIFTLLLFATVRLFLRERAHIWWVFLAILIGGGLGGHLEVLSRFDFVTENPFLERTFVRGIRVSSLYEMRRGAYPLNALFDSHYMLVWILATGALVAFYQALKQSTIARVSVAAGLFFTITFMHVYEGVTLMVVAAAVWLLCYLKDLARAAATRTAIACALATVAAFALLLTFYRSGGLPVTEWRAPPVLFSTVLLAHPLAWAVMVWKGGDFWRNATVDRCFLLGWLLGCLSLTLASPFYPYPDRGIMTMAIPVYVIAGSIYFSVRKRLAIAPALLVIGVLGVTPFWLIAKRWEDTWFSQNRPYIFLGPDHQAIAGELTRRAGPRDVLLADEREVLWLAPEHPGRFYYAHFFLTVDYEQKRARAVQFFAADPIEQAAFLRTENIRFVYVPRRENPERFERVPGLRLVESGSVGSLFEFDVALAASAVP